MLKTKNQLLLIYMEKFASIPRLKKNNLSSAFSDRRLDAERLNVVPGEALSGATLQELSAKQMLKGIFTFCPPPFFFL